MLLGLVYVLIGVGVVCSVIVVCFWISCWYLGDWLELLIVVG